MHRVPAVEAHSDGTDERVLIEAAQRDPIRFAELYERNFGRVYTFIARRTRERGEAEDLTAEVFQRALANLERFEWRGVPLWVWLLQIARNALADRWRRVAREPKTGGHRVMRVDRQARARNDVSGRSM